MPFGWNLSSLWYHLLEQPVRAWIQQQGIQLAWFVDDILILGRSKEETKLNTAKVIRLFNSLGLKINMSKSQTTPTQQIEYLGQLIDLQNNHVAPLEPKRMAAQRATARFLQGHKIPPKFLAKVAGILLDQLKGNPALHSVPQQLMQWAAKLAASNKNMSPAKAWSLPTLKHPNLQSLLKEASTTVSSSHPRVLRPSSSQEYILQTDASDFGWEASLWNNGKEIKCAGLTWTPNQSQLHSTHKEALATSLALKFLGPLIPPR